MYPGGAKSVENILRRWPQMHLQAVRRGLEHGICPYSRTDSYRSICGSPSRRQSQRSVCRGISYRRAVGKSSHVPKGIVLPYNSFDPRLQRAPKINSLHLVWSRPLSGNSVSPLEKRCLSFLIIEIVRFQQMRPGM